MIAILSVGLAVLGVILASDYKVVQAGCYVGGALLVVLLIVQGIRTQRSQSDADQAFMSSQNQNRIERQQTDLKIDGLFALLETKKPPQPMPSNTHSSAKPPTLQAPLDDKSQLPVLPPSTNLTITQTDEPSTRADAPFKSRIVVQTTQVFSSLKLAIRCNKELIDGNVDMSEILVMARDGVVRTTPNIFIFSYESANPPFGPSNPVAVNLWSREKFTCNQAATF